MKYIAKNECSHFYDGDGLRISRTDNITGVVTYYVWDTENPTGYPQVVEEIENNQVVRRYGYGHFLENVDIWNGSAFERFYVVRDGTNSVRMLLDSTGNVAATYDYDAFGNVLSSSFTNPICSQNNYQFHSEYRDQATGLVYLRARWYSTEDGRFNRMDSFEGVDENPITINKYIAFDDNPIEKFDPSGYTTWPTEQYRVTSFYGERIHPVTGETRKPHFGLDIGQVGTSGKVYAADTGEVVEIGTDINGGDYIKIKENMTGHFQYYMHTSNSKKLTVKQRVEEGSVIGQSNLSGRVRGLHLHFARKTPSGLWEDPLPHIISAPLPQWSVNREALSEFMQRISREGLKASYVSTSGVQMMMILF